MGLLILIIVQDKFKINLLYQFNCYQPIFILTSYKYDIIETLLLLKIKGWWYLIMLVANICKTEFGDSFRD